MNVYLLIFVSMFLWFVTVFGFSPTREFDLLTIVGYSAGLSVVCVLISRLASVHIDATDEEME